MNDAEENPKESLSQKGTADLSSPKALQDQTSSSSPIDASMDNAAGSPSTPDACRNDVQKKTSGDTEGQDEAMSSDVGSSSDSEDNQEILKIYDEAPTAATPIPSQLSILPLPNPNDKEEAKKDEGRMPSTKANDEVRVYRQGFKQTNKQTKNTNIFKFCLSVDIHTKPSVSLAFPHFDFPAMTKINRVNFREKPLFQLLSLFISISFKFFFLHFFSFLLFLMIFLFFFFFNFFALLFFKFFFF